MWSPPESFGWPFKAFCSLHAPDLEANGVVANANQDAKDLGVACISLDPAAGGVAELPNGSAYCCASLDGSKSGFWESSGLIM